MEETGTEEGESGEKGGTKRGRGKSVEEQNRCKEREERTEWKGWEVRGEGDEGRTRQNREKEKKSRKAGVLKKEKEKMT